MFVHLRPHWEPRLPELGAKVAEHNRKKSFSVNLSYYGFHYAELLLRAVMVVQLR